MLSFRGNKKEKKKYTTNPTLRFLSRTHTSLSTLGSPAARPSRSPCSASPHPSQVGRLDSAHSEAPVSTAAPSGSAGQATICLPPHAQHRSGPSTPDLTFQYVQTDTAQLIYPRTIRAVPAGRSRNKPTDVGMVDLGQEAHLGGRHRVLLREKQFQFENTICDTGTCVCLDSSCGRVHLLWNGLPSGPWMVTSK